MKLPTDNYRFGDDLPSTARALMQVLPTIAKQVNLVSEGRLAGSYNALAEPPVMGLYQVGDYIRNSAPLVLGTPGAQYVLKGWICVTGGEPGVWVEDRGVTGT
jgi:hypothetical protein